MVRVHIEWIHPKPGEGSGLSPETCRAFLEILEDIRQQMVERGIEVAILESTSAVGSSGKILLNGVSLEEIVPAQSVRGSSGSGACPAGGGPCAGGSGEQDTPCETLPESVIRLAVVKAAGRC